ncbi:MAG: choice-of-anchor J domain-containing protein [Sedimentibacter sp.]|uniref:choice-of-anchor J domain-containing protein n=1 Tax=Sedimentibacter sp. TaxID=1960295 RepID=UPI0031598D0D
MIKRRFLSKLIAGVTLISLMAPLVAMGAEASPYQNWNAERYGDHVDIDAKLDKISKDDSFTANAENRIKEQAKKLKFNDSAPKGTEDLKNTKKVSGRGSKTNEGEAASTSDSSVSTNFTYDGGTKLFLNYELDFKEFTLRSVGENVEVWVADDLSFPDSRPAHVVTQEQADMLRDEFDQNIYPIDTEFFGMPDALDGSNSPLIDWGYFPEGYYEGSDKIIILVDNIKDEQYYDQSYPFFVAGFFWQTLENYIDRNIITIDTKDWGTRLESTFFPTTIHELQHLIHADNDGAEESWINEGMSTFSEYLGGYGHDSGSVNFYLDHPENSLVKWDDHYSAATGPETIADYGQVYLFTLYMNDKLGRDFIHDLAVNTKHGIESINEVLRNHGSSLSFTELYQNFIAALVMDSDRAGDGKYNFDSINLRDMEVDKNGTRRGMTVDFEKAMEYEKEGVPAWGGDFKELSFQDKIRTISFDGVDFLPVPWLSVTDPLNSTNKVLWGNEGDEADYALLFEADLTAVDSATLRFDNYVQIEEQWDFGVVQVSTDGGNTWTSLSNENTRNDIVDEGYPRIKENLPGFTGYYEGWQNETFNLTPYAGQKVLISFRYLTDWGTYEAGWYIDNIEIPETGFSNDGSSTDNFFSMNQLLGKYVDYTVTFINEREIAVKKGTLTNYKVVTVEPFNVSSEDALSLRQLFQEGKNYMITTYAAPADDKNPVDFTYEVFLKESNPKE